MKRLKSIHAVCSDTSGATAVEYGVILAMIVIVIIIAIQGVADETIAMWGDINSKSAAAMANE